MRTASPCPRQAPFSFTATLHTGIRAGRVSLQRFNSLSHSMRGRDNVLRSMTQSEGKSFAGLTRLALLNHPPSLPFTHKREWQKSVESKCSYSNGFLVSFSCPVPVPLKIRDSGGSNKSPIPFPWKQLHWRHESWASPISPMELARGTGKTAGSKGDG